MTTIHIIQTILEIIVALTILFAIAHEDYCIEFINRHIFHCTEQEDGNGKEQKH